MSRFIVRALANGTKIDLAPSARNAEIALDRAMKSSLAKKANAFVVFERATMTPVLTGVRR